jgi:hypothetical protein
MTEATQRGTKSIGRQNGQRWTMACAEELTPTWTGPPSSQDHSPYIRAYQRSVARHKPFQAPHQFQVSGLKRGPDSLVSVLGQRFCAWVASDLREVGAPRVSAVLCRPALCRPQCCCKYTTLFFIIIVSDKHNDLGNN